MNLYSCCRIRSKIQMMSEERIRGVSGHFVLCDMQKEYAEHLFQKLSETYEGSYQFYLFSQTEKIREYLDTVCPEVLLIAEEYGESFIREINAGRKYILTADRERKSYAGGIAVFRYQPVSGILKEIGIGTQRPARRKPPMQIRESGGYSVQRTQNENTREKQKGETRIRDKPKGLIGIYSPIHRIGKTRFAIRLGQKLAKHASVLYINMEGYSGGNYYFPEGMEKDLGDLLYCLKQERDDHGIRISTMTGQSGGMDYIMPMKNEQDVRSVRKEEWIDLLDLILEKCIYDTVILDLGDAVNGLYDILRKCAKVYTLYISEGSARAKLNQYEENLKAAGYADVLARTVKKPADEAGETSGRSRGV